MKHLIAVLAFAAAARLVTAAGSPKGVGQAEAGAHVRPGFEEAPEVAGVLLEALRAERSKEIGHDVATTLQRCIRAIRIAAGSHVERADTAGYTSSVANF